MDNESRSKHEYGDERGIKCLYSHPNFQEKTNKLVLRKVGTSQGIRIANSRSALVFSSRLETRQQVTGEAEL